jgi:pyruvate dehydrogenase E2 component (dihydrolipoamide acetyltransferase)
MITKIIMPKLGETMEEGKIGKLIKKEGDRVERGEPYFEVVTDKANFEVESLKSGIIRKWLVKEGDEIKVIEVIGYIADTMDEPLPKEEVKTEVKQAEPVKLENKPLNAVQHQAPAGGRIFISPAARKLAAIKSIDISQIKGSGPNGRIMEKDVNGFSGTPAADVSSSSSAKYKSVKLTGMRKIIAERLSKSMREAPHFYVQVDVEMSKAMKAREEAKKNRSPVSLNDFIIKACAEALKKHPGFNVHFINDEIREFAEINIGFAVSLENGLVVPVIKDAVSKTAEAIAEESKALIKKAREGKLTPSDMEGGTFTISNMGMLGIDSFTAIINPPQVGILAIAGIKSVPGFLDGKVIEKKIMKITLSSDHRVIDGVYAASFVNAVKEGLESLGV